MSSLSTCFPPASRAQIRSLACWVLVSRCGSMPDSISSAVMSYSPTQRKPPSSPRENASDAPGGARELFSCVRMRMVGSCFSLPMNITLRTAAAMSMEPSPRCRLCIPAALFRCPISKIAQPVRCATCPNRMKIGRTSFARFMSTSAPRYAWIGSMMTSRALFSMMAFSIRSSESVSCTSLSSMTSTRSRSAPASIRRGLTVSPRPSSAVW